jgi:hypothetical protein
MTSRKASPNGKAAYTKVATDLRSRFTWIKSTLYFAGVIFST